jgi:hypothetical protein
MSDEPDLLREAQRIVVPARGSSVSALVSKKKFNARSGRRWRSSRSCRSSIDDRTRANPDNAPLPP